MNSGRFKNAGFNRYLSGTFSGRHLGDFRGIIVPYNKSCPNLELDAEQCLEGSLAAISIGVIPGKFDMDAVPAVPVKPVVELSSCWVADRLAMVADCWSDGPGKPPSACAWGSSCSASSLLGT